MDQAHEDYMFFRGVLKAWGILFLIWVVYYILTKPFRDLRWSHPIRLLASLYAAFYVFYCCCGVLGALFYNKIYPGVSFLILLIPLAVLWLTKVSCVAKASSGTSNEQVFR